MGRSGESGVLFASKAQSVKQLAADVERRWNDPSAAIWLPPRPEQHRAIALALRAAQRKRDTDDPCFGLGSRARDLTEKYPPRRFE